MSPGVAHGRHHRGAGGGGQLHARRADPTGGARDQHPLAHAQIGVGEEGVEGGGEDLGEPAGLGPGERVGHGQGVGLLDHGHGGLATAAHQGHDPVARREPGHLCADRHHLAGQLHAGDVGRRPRRGRIEPLALHHVGPVEPGRPHGDQQLGVAGHRIVPLLPVQLCVPDHHGVHRAHPRQHRGRRLRPRPRPQRRRARTGILGGMALYDIPVHTLQGDESSLGEYAGKTLLVVNVASKCGLTPQYEGLERLQKTYGDRGFSVVGFPSNQFMGQEPGTPEEIQQFCSTTYGVTFPLFEKIDVNGDDRHPIYEELTAAPDAEGNAGDITWNFEKFLVSGTGEVIGRFRPQVEPEDPAIVDAIEAALPA